jgi:hypothetical protein
MPQNPKTENAAIAGLASAITSRLGMKPTDRRPQASTEVTVKAPMPSRDTPYPPNMDEIMLGTRTKKPTGTWTPDEPVKTEPPSSYDKPLSPYMQKVWSEVKRDYPYISDGVSVQPSNMMNPNAVANFNGTNGWGEKIPQGFINVNPEALISEKYPEYDYSLLAHELTHRAQERQWPSEGIPGNLERIAYFGKDYNTKGSNIPWENRPGEQQAEEVSKVAQDKFSRAAYPGSKALATLAKLSPVKK